MSDHPRDAAAVPVRIAHLDTPEQIRQAFRIIEGIWGEASGIPTNMLRAIAHAGGYVVGAYDDEGEMIGTSVAFHGRMDGRDILHSHITGVLHRGQGIGYQLKFHQRAWAADQGLAAITWTFDPLVARNGWFNLAKLGAVGQAYLDDHYGPMDDPINKGDRTDRVMILWPVEPVAVPLPRGDPTVLLTVDRLDRPTLHGLDVDGSASVYAVTVPPDIENLRSRTPYRAQEWRRVVRETMGQAMSLGYQATACTRDGTYLLSRPTVDQVTVDHVTVGQVTVDQVTVDQVTVDQVTVDQVTVDPVGQ